MIKKTITYVDFNGNERVEDHYFNLSKAELVELELSREGGFAEELEEASTSGDPGKIIQAFKDILRRSYGQRSEDGRRFVKTPELFEEFTQTEAYSELFMQLVTEEETAGDFVNGLIPVEMAQEAARMAEAQREREKVRNIRKPQDRLPKQVKDDHRIENPVQIEETEEPVLDSEPVQEIPDTVDQNEEEAPEEKTFFTHAELVEMPADELRELQLKGLDGSPSRGYTVRPPHESGPGFQTQ